MLIVTKCNVVFFASKGQDTTDHYVCEFHVSVGGFLIKLSLYAIVSSDINECKYQNGGCSHECVNDDGGHHCACPKPLELSDDNHNCRGA